MSVEESAYRLHLIFGGDPTSRSRRVTVVVILDSEFQVIEVRIDHYVGDEKIVIGWNSATKSFGFDQKSVHLINVRFFTSKPYDHIFETYEEWKRSRWSETGNEAVEEELGSLFERARDALKSTDELSPLKEVQGTKQAITLIIDKFSFHLLRGDRPKTYTIALDTMIDIGHDNIAESITITQCRLFSVATERELSKEARTACKTDSHCILFRKI